MNNEKQLIAKIKKFHESGKTKMAIEGWLQFEHGMSVNEARALTKEALGSKRKATSNWEPVIKVIRENYGKVSKQELIELMMEASGGKYSSMNHAYNYIKFAQEYARQELEAKSK